MITSVDRGSAAEEAGINEGMVIKRIVAGNQRIDIRSLDDFRNAEKLLRPGTEVAFMVLRPDPRTNAYSTAFVTVRVP